MRGSRLDPPDRWSTLFIGVPLLEIFVLIQVGQVIGPWWTILLLIVDSILGTWLIRREGGKAWRALTTALETGRMPARELADGTLILIGGTLMLTPGFVTDAFGILLILPVTRPVARRLLTQVISPTAAPRRRSSPEMRIAPDPDPVDPWSRARSWRTSPRWSASADLLLAARHGAGGRDRSRRRAAGRGAP